MKTPVEARVKKLESRVATLEKQLNLTTSNNSSTDSLPPITINTVTNTITHSNVNNNSTLVPQPVQSDPPCAAVPPAVIEAAATAAPIIVKAVENTKVYDLLKTWLHDPTNKILHWQKAHSLTNELRQLVFDRDLKAQSKYGAGLTLDDKAGGLPEAANKLADALFFLFKHHKSLPSSSTTATTTSSTKSQKTLVQDLHNLIGTLLKEMK